MNMPMFYCVLIVLFMCNGALSTDQASTRKRVTLVTRELIQKLNDVDVASKVMDKLNRLDNKAFKYEFMKLHMRAKLLYLVNLDIDQYEQFLRRFDGQQEWSAYCKKLSDRERRFLPSWTQQMKFIRDCYYTYYLSTFFCSLFAEKKAAQPTDIARWKKYYYTSDSGSTCPFAKEVLMDLEFQRKKLKLLNLPF